MIRIERAALCLAWTVLLAGCGGGGGGDGSGPAPGGPPGTGRQIADVTGAAAPLFAEVFRGFVGQEISPLDEFVATVRGGDLPTESLANAERKIDCMGGGSVTLTVAGSGADITYQYSQCVEQGLTFNGRFALQFTNVNEVVGTVRLSRHVHGVLHSQQLVPSEPDPERCRHRAY
jgi:hypothetical protein